MPASVLFVDDEEKARKYFALAMADAFDVKTAGNADEALAILAEHAAQIAIVISDQRMPATSGVQLLKTVREQYPHIVRLLTTAYTDIEDAIAAINRGEILRYIQKPWDIGTLRAELKHAMNYFQLRSERDALLEEKLSVRQSLVQVERLSQLLVFAETLSFLRFSGQAMRRYIDEALGTAPPAASTTAQSAHILDLWSQTLAETGRMQQFVGTVSAKLHGCGVSTQQFADAVDAAALCKLIQDGASAASPALAVTVGATQMPEGGVRVDGPLFRMMLNKLLAALQAGNATSVMVSFSATGSPSHSGLQLVFDVAGIDLTAMHTLLGGPVGTRIPALCADLLLVFLACAHHGGSVELGRDEGGGSIVLSLPANPRDALLPADSPYWHEKVLTTFESGTLT